MQAKEWMLNVWAETLRMFAAADAESTIHNFTQDKITKCFYPVQQIAAK